MLLTYGIVYLYWWDHPTYLYGFYSIPLPLVFFGFLLLGLILTCSGVTILTRFSERKKFLTKDGEIIHSCRPWHKGPETGLFLTSCELVVSINQKSEATSNVGYQMVNIEHGTCNECAMEEGRVVLEKVSRRRSW